MSGFDMTFVPAFFISGVLNTAGFEAISTHSA
jgi:hypothetical protein